MSPTTVIALIQIAAQLAQVIDAEVAATNNAEAQAAWQQASQLYQQGLTELQAKIGAGQ